MADGLPDFSDRKTVEAWLRGRPREDAIILATRAALRVLPLVASEIDQEPDSLRSSLLPLVLRATASSWLMAQAFFHGQKEDVAGAAVSAARAARAANAARTADDAAFSALAAAGDAATVSASDTGSAAASAAAEAALSAFSAARAFSSAFAAADANASAAADAMALTYPNRRPRSLFEPLWPIVGETLLKEIERAWRALAAHLADHPREGWHVWIDWYEARLRGDPPDWERERAYVLDLDDFWTQGPAAANTEIARRLADLAADRPSGERLDVIPESGRIGTVPAEPENPEALENAVQKVEDALEDFRASPSANIAGYALGPALRKLDRTLARYRENPRRLHDDFADSARIIARAAEDDSELDTSPVRDLAETSAQGALDIRIASKEVSDMEADRRRRRARAPSAESRAALTRLLQEAGEVLEPELTEEMAEDVAELEASDTPEDELLAEGAAKDAELRLAHRVAWLFRFGRMNEGQITVLAERAMRNVDEIERLVNLLKTFDDWWPLISLVLRGG